MKTNSLIDQEFEHAFDDGIFSVVSAGDNNGDNATSCVVRDPADTPKVYRDWVKQYGTTLPEMPVQAGACWSGCPHGDG